VIILNYLYWLHLNIIWILLYSFFFYGTALNSDTISSIVSKDTKLKFDCNTNVYYFYSAYIDNKLNPLRLKIIYPTTQQDIDDFTRPGSVVIRESPDLYKKVTEKHICSISPSRTQWMRDIFNHSPSSTQARDIFFEDDSFLLVPDTKWNKESVNELWCLAIVKMSNLRTLRDLTADHLPLLKSIRNQAFSAIQTKYRITPTQLVGFIQYLPSFFHLHIHFTHYSKVGTSTRAILLDDIIYNLELQSSYYSGKTFTYTLGINTPLYQAISLNEPQYLQ